MPVIELTDMLVTLSIDFHWGRIVKKVIISTNSYLNIINFASDLVTLSIVFYL